ncbi:MAG TPA: lipocalin family protein, partial [Terriglobia bacterium]|nr:lipocalin family protein [Terriglobia bacterium]
MTTSMLMFLLFYTVVPDVDLQRYAGEWHEIARLPNRFQKDCIVDVTANYTLRKDGRIDVTNRCRTKDGKFIEAKGVAKTVGKGQPNSVLKVRFAPAFLSFLPMVWGDYQILALAPDYSYAAVGSPDLKYLWILSRTPHMPENTYQKLVEAMRSQGFNVE